MPPHADPALEKRILDAARRLWRRGGEKALTMRAVAAAARTTTPTVYGRFRNKRDIMRDLRMLIRRELFDILYETKTPREVCERYISFAFAHPYDYRLLTESWTLTHSGVEPRPTSELMKQRLADMFGGEPSEYARLTMALWAMLHARWKNLDIHSPGAAAALAIGLILFAIAATFPPVFGLLAH